MFIIRSTRNKGLLCCAWLCPRVAKEDDSSCDPLFSHSGEAQHPMSDPWELPCTVPRAACVPRSSQESLHRGSVRRLMR